MFVLLKKELGNFFSSAAGFIIIAVFLTLTGAFLWLIPSEYNILDGGYANVDGLFMLSPWLFLFLIPALTMKLFADEWASGSVELLYTKPLTKTSIVLSKYFAGWILSILSLVPTLLYMVSVGVMGVTPFNLDMGGFWGSFIGLLFLSALYTAVGVFCSSVTRNSMVAFVLSALMCFIIYYGFQFLSELFQNASVSQTIAAFGIASHYDSMSRGVLDLKDVMYFILAVYLFIYATIIIVEPPHHRFTILITIIALYIASGYFVLRLDLTSEKRYTLSDNTKNLVRDMDKDVSVDIYLGGNVNRGFLRLKDATVNLVKELNAYSGGKFKWNVINPSESADAKVRNAEYAMLVSKGLKPTMVYDRNSDGGVVEKTVFPWAVISASGDTINVNLLKNIQGMSGDENLNSSVEALEYEVTDALRRLTNANPESIAFLEGHDEWSEPYVMSITESLSAYYNVDRGVLGTDATALDKYKVVIVAGPLEKFSVADKFIIDNYIMHGGKVLWLIDGVRTDKENIGIANELSLDDMLFTYGVRVSPLLLLDTQCATVPINVALEGEQPKFEPMPWYYAPILIPNPSNVITRNIAPVKAEFPSVVELVGDNGTGLTASALLFSSAKAGLDKAPMQINPAIIRLSPESEFFSFSYLPVAVLLEGKFTSVFANRMTPPEISSGGEERLKESESTKMIVISDGDIIRNDVHAVSDGYSIVPLGTDEYTGQTFGNEQFILNSVNYLADDEGWLSLRGREWKIRLLDKKMLSEYRVMAQIINLILPLLLLIIFIFVYQIVRKKRWC